jgi:hypothetical protein
MKLLKISFLILITIGLFPFSLIITPIILAMLSFLSYDKIEIDKNEYLEFVEKKSANNSIDSQEYHSTTIYKEPEYTCSNSSRANSQENLVSYFLSTLDKNSYTVINNVTIPSNGNTSHTQIDHVVVSCYGIFCIETKSHKGWIFGSDHQKNWTQVLYKEHYQFYNPLKQNFAHVQALRSLLGMNLKRPVIPIVVFTTADKINVTGDGNVGGIIYMIEKIQKSKTIVYDPYERERIINSIDRANKKDDHTRLKHNIEIQNLVALSKA